jgi:hypothetical protein
MAREAGISKSLSRLMGAAYGPSNKEPFLGISESYACHSALSLMHIGSTGLGGKLKVDDSSTENGESSEREGNRHPQESIPINGSTAASEY